MFRILTATGLALCAACLFALDSNVQTFGQDKSDDDAKAQAPPPKAGADDVELKTIEDKVSYGYGLNQGRRLAAGGIELDPELIARGYRDAFKKADPLISDEDLNAAFAEFDKKVAALRKEKTEKASAENKAEGEKFLAANAKKEGVKTTKSGLQYKILKEGTGKTPGPEDKVKTHYHGTLIDGTVFDSSVQRKEPIIFPVKGVISGWTEALQLMKEGGKWRLFIPSDLAYGERGSGAIGPNAVLQFDVELLEVNPEPNPNPEGGQ